jgi:hypothetical protein
MRVPQRHSASALFFGWAAVVRQQRAGREDVAPHRRLDLALGRPGRQIQDDVKRVKLKDVTAAGSKERARPIVADMAHIVLPLLRTTGQLFLLRNSLGELASSGGQIVEHPV